MKTLTIHNSWEQYDHHGTVVMVDTGLKGHHSDACLCYSCSKFFPDDLGKNCAIAQVLYRLCILAGITTPVWECAEFMPANAPRAGEEGEGG